jgi:5-formyltetrahydrofolate cyclo-ligase
MKPAIRQRIITARDAIPEPERCVLSEAITARLLALPAYREAQTVLGYLHFGGEYHSARWVQQALADGKQVILPRVDSGTRELALHRVTDLRTQIAPGKWNIPEPLANCPRFDTVDTLDFILLPGVAFTRYGARLGYGGGFYDKLLPHLPQRAVRAAAAYEMQVVETLPEEETDQRVAWLVTEHETIACGDYSR